jgi:predicted Co/Zn/Cd cation transporter (cation efflux family)
MIAVFAMAVTPIKIALVCALEIALILGAMDLAVRQDLSMTPVAFAMAMTQHAQAALMM